MNRFLFISILFFISCSSHKKKEVVEPDDLIPIEKMAPVLADVHLLEATLGLRAPIGPQMRSHIPPEFMHDSVPSVSLPNVSTIPNQKDTFGFYNIFKRHNITRKQFDASMEWYTANPDKLNDLYDQVIIDLTQRQAEDRTGKKAVSADSLKK